MCNKTALASPAGASFCRLQNTESIRAPVQIATAYFCYMQLKMVLPVATLLLAAACKQKDNNGFTVDGTLKGGAGQTIYFLEAALNNRIPVIVDSAKADNKGHFTVQGSRVEENLYLLRTAGNEDPFAKVVNDAARIRVTADPVGNPPYRVEGSPASTELLAFTDATNRQVSTVDALVRQRDSLLAAGVSDSLLQPLQQRHDAAAAQAYRSYTVQLIKNSKSPTVAVNALGTYVVLANDQRRALQPIGNDELVGLLSATANRFPDHKGLAQLRTNVASEVARQAAQPQQAPASDEPVALLNKPAPELTLNDPDGKPVSLSSFRGKWVLVDFWASWCGPCRAENPNVVQAYKNFSGRNFTILGVSLDREKDAWTGAVRQDGLTWTHVSDLAFWNSKAVSTYGFQSIPFNVLIDPNGTVVAMGLRGPALQQKLAEVLK
jgi:peroxiredoxin